MQIFGVTGESLGSIGTKPEPEPEPEPVPALQPEWKRLLVAKPSVSLRKGIAWVSNTVRLMLLFCLGCWDRGMKMGGGFMGSLLLTLPFLAFRGVDGWVIKGLPLFLCVEREGLGFFCLVHLLGYRCCYFIASGRVWGVVCLRCLEIVLPCDLVLFCSVRLLRSARLLFLSLYRVL